MSGLLYKESELTPDIVGLECHNCHHLHAVGEDDGWDDLGTGDRSQLICHIDECGVSGFIPRRKQSRGKVAERFPAGVGASYMPLPHVLMEHASELSLSPNELLVVIALERFRRRLGQQVNPSRTTLARLTCLSEDQVKRSVAALAKKKLIERRQPGGGRGQGRASNHYLLDPLWDRLAELVAAQDPTKESTP